MKVLQLRTEKCVQCGECMSACSKAWFKEDNPALSRIKIENKATYPNINVCNQCGACIEICPTKALERERVF